MLGFSLKRLPPWALKSSKIALPLMVWGLTAAPSFAPAYTGSFELAAYTPPKIQDNTPSFVDELFEKQVYRPAIDSAVEDIYQALQEYDLEGAIAKTDRLLAEFPNFHLGYLIRGDLLSLKAGRSLAQVGDVPHKIPSFRKDEWAGLQQEALARFRAISDSPGKNEIPSELLELDSDIKHVVLVDTSRSRLFLYENSFPYPRLVTDFYITQGRMGADKEREGDKRTPIGVYNVTEILPDEKLTDFYGPAAFPINYPNAWDKRLGKTGHGIWLHGTPRKFVSRPPKDSDGCVVLTNHDLLAIKPFIQAGNTPVVISSRLEFVSPDIWKHKRKEAIALLKGWREQLEKGLEVAQPYYAQDVLIDGKPLMEWQRKRLGDHAEYGDVRIDDISMMKYPSADGEMLWMSFRQEDGVLGEVRKQQYWARIDDTWKIVQESHQRL